VAVQQQKYFHCRVSDSFVSIDKRVIKNQREAQGCGFGGEVWMEVGSTKALARLCER
jgi:hypothetical protein